MISETSKIYKILLRHYGAQGWWPVLNLKTGLSVYGHSVKPLNGRVMFEICIGAILTQNVAWKNVEKSLFQLKKEGLLTPRRLAAADNDTIASLIKSSGYYNQKVLKIKNFIAWFSTFNYSFRRLNKIDTRTLRGDLLSVKGIGPETADSILLYALGRKIFVVDAYTKRVFTRIGIIGEDWNYDKIQQFFHEKFCGDVSLYNEYHALVVVHGKDCCKTVPDCVNCCLAQLCRNKPARPDL
ncbi:MAG TPA: endonuclease III domain-containing protein [Spirochaetota bacterium]|nr:endonuclease III domain-containing protein [Spirochaetota bacterium]